MCACIQVYLYIYTRALVIHAHNITYAQSYIKVSTLYTIHCGFYRSLNAQKSDVWTMHLFPNPVTIIA